MEQLLLIVLVMGLGAELLTKRRVGVFAQVPAHWAHLFGGVAWLAAAGVVLLLMLNAGTMPAHFARGLGIGAIATVALGVLAIHTNLVGQLGLFQTAILAGALGLLIGLSF